MGKKCALISMPMMQNEAIAPTLAIPVIASALRSSSIDTDVYYFNLDFFKLLLDNRLDGVNQIGGYALQVLTNCVFAELHWGTKPDMALLNRGEFLKEAEIDKIMQIKEQVKHLFDKLLSDHDWGSYSVVGFSCTYYQVIASLLFSRMLKERFPEVRIIFGGSFFDGESSEEIIKREKHIDYIVEGYSDSFIVPLFQALLEGKTICSPRIHSRKDQKGTTAIEESPIKPNGFGYPDYSDYILQCKAILGWAPPTLDVEISRGCKKANSSPCIFCDEGKFKPIKAKPAEDFADELRFYNKEYGVKVFNINDSLISAREVIRYLEPLIPFGFLYNIYGLTPIMTKEDMKQMSKLGVNHIQVGIESFSNHLNRIMNKEQNDSLRSINVLKWAKHYGIEMVFYNILCGVPGEKKEDYNENIRIAKNLYHLFPPKDARYIYGKREAPILSNAEGFGVSSLRIGTDLSDLFPKEYDKMRLAQFFCFSYPGLGECKEEINNLMSEVRIWEEMYKRGAKLSYRRTSPCEVKIMDSRYGEERARLLDRNSSLIISLIDEPISLTDISLKADLCEEVVLTALADLVAEGLAYTDGSGRYIGLALPEEG